MDAARYALRRQGHAGTPREVGHAGEQERVYRSEHEEDLSHRIDAAYLPRLAQFRIGAHGVPESTHFDRLHCPGRGNITVRHSIQRRPPNLCALLEVQHGDW